MAQRSPFLAVPVPQGYPLAGLEGGERAAQGVQLQAATLPRAAQPMMARLAMPIAQGLPFCLLAPSERRQVPRFRLVIVLAFPAVRRLFRPVRLDRLQHTLARLEVRFGRTICAQALAQRPQAALAPEAGDLDRDLPDPQHRSPPPRFQSQASRCQSSVQVGPSGRPPQQRRALREGNPRG